MNMDQPLQNNASIMLVLYFIRDCLSSDNMPLKVKLTFTLIKSKPKLSTANWTNYLGSQFTLHSYFVIKLQISIIINYIDVMFNLDSTIIGKVLPTVCIKTSTA